MWLEAGILESDEWHETEQGTPQVRALARCSPTSFCITPLISGSINGEDVMRAAKCRARVYADDFVLGFETAADARWMLADLKARLAKFGLTLHEDKARLIEFGRLPALARRQRGERRPETFAFLGFTHYCGWTRDGRFIVKRKTQSKRLTRKLTAMRQEARCLMHRPLAEQQRWYASVLRGHYGYYRCAAKLALPERVPARSPPHLVRSSPATEPAEPAYGLGLVRGCDHALSLAC